MNEIGSKIETGSKWNQKWNQHHNQHQNQTQKGTENEIRWNERLNPNNEKWEWEMKSNWNKKRYRK
jgi:hypothetical protein